MPILTDVRCFFSYRPRAIDEDLLQALRDPILERIGSNPNATILRLECYLQITRQTLSLRELQTRAGQAKVEGSVGALFSNRFEGEVGKKVNSRAQRLRNLLELAGAKNAAAAIAAMTSRKGSGKLESSIDAFENAELDQERVTLWRGWSTQNRLGQTVLYELHNLYEGFGASFTDQFFRAICDYQHGRIHGIRLANSFALYLARYSKEINFADSRQVSEVVKSFVVAEFKSIHRKGCQIEGGVTVTRNLLAFTLTRLRSSAGVIV